MSYAAAFEIESIYHAQEVFRHIYGGFNLLTPSAYDAQRTPRLPGDIAFLLVSFRATDGQLLSRARRTVPLS